MEHDVVLTCADGSVRKFRIYGRTAPRAGEVVTLPIDGKLVKARTTKQLARKSSDRSTP